VNIWRNNWRPVGVLEQSIRLRAHRIRAIHVLLLRISLKHGTHVWQIMWLFFDSMIIFLIHRNCSSQNFRAIQHDLSQVEPNFGRGAGLWKHAKIIYYCRFGSITNCAWISLKILAMFLLNPWRTDRDKNNSFEGIKNSQKQKFFAHAFGTVISCKPVNLVQTLKRSIPLRALASWTEVEPLRQSPTIPDSNNAYTRPS
jgi:hypothetical protein